MNMNDEEIFEEFITSRNLKYQTIAMYKNSINHYTNFNNLTLEELFEEAEKEEEQSIRWKHRKLKKRLTDFRIYLYKTYIYSTANIYLHHIKTLYNHFEIEIHKLPYISDRNVKKHKPISYKDLPDHEIIKASLKITIPIMRAIILFITSSGCGRKETLNLTIQDFIDATYKYHNSTDIHEIIGLLDGRDDVVPYFEINREKMNKYYYTFCSPEATQEIINYLIGEKRDLSPEKKLFKFNFKYLQNRFAEINNMLNLGKVGAFNRFRAHMLRKFHSSQLLNADNNLNSTAIDFLQGRAKTGTDKVYLLENPDKVYKKYIDSVDCLAINWDYNQIDMKTPEVVQLETEHKQVLKEKEGMQEQIDELFRQVDKIIKR